jgi:hypothetical protein
MEQSAPPEVSTTERAQLVEVLDRFSAGKTSVACFAGQAARHLESPDRGALAIAEAWWDASDLDFLAWWHTVRSFAPDRQAILERCRLFLRTGLPYEWPEPPRLTLAELGLALLAVLGVTVLGHLLFGLVLIVLLGLWLAGITLVVTCAAAGGGVIVGYRAIRQWKLDQCDAYQAAGDIDAWPFLRRADYERALADGRRGGLS